MISRSVENSLISSGYFKVAGIDEAGRGPLAGPVVAAAVILPVKIDLRPINDSKKLTAKQREEAYSFLLESAVKYGVAVVSNRTIDRINILKATFLAMKKAALELKPLAEHLLIDGNKNIPDLSISQISIIKGDGKEACIAAASIIAKVVRDRLMEVYDVKYPGYGFNEHKGYGTKNHLKKLKELGPCAIHRVSFAPVRTCLVH